MFILLLLIESISVYLRVTVSKLNQTSECDKWMSKSFIWCDSRVWINDKSSLQQIGELIPLEEHTCFSDFIFTSN